MFGLGAATRIYLAVGSTDMRKGFEGLYGLVRDQLGLDPLSGHLCLFCNKGRNRLKVLYWDGSGLWICAKRLERGRFSWPSGDEDAARVTLSYEELSLLLGGIDLTRTRRKNWYRKEAELSEKI
jgi:transposase